MLAVRWAVTITSIALATQHYEDTPYSAALWSAVVLSYTVLRTLKPIRYTGDVQSLLEILAGVVLNVVCVATTGYWESPFILMLIVPVTVAGFARGYGFALRIGVVSTLAVSLPYLIEDPDRSRIVLSAQWTLVLLLVALIAGYTRQISGEADRQHTLALDRLDRLADANALLYNLHRVTQTLPASLDLDDVLDTTVNRLRGLFDFDTAVILGLDDTDGNVGDPAPRRRQPHAHAPVVRGPTHPPAAGDPGRGRAVGHQPAGRRLVRPRPAVLVRPLRRPPRPGLHHRPAGRRAQRRPPLRRPAGRAAARLRRAGGSGHRQRPLVLPAPHRGRGRGTHSDRP